MLVTLQAKGLDAGAPVEADGPAMGALPAVPKAPGRAPTGALVTQRFDDGSALYEDGLVYDPSSQKFRKPRPPVEPEPAAEGSAGVEAPSTEAPADAPEEKRAGKRRVRTAEGARLFGQPIGTVIREDVVPDGVRRALARDLANRTITQDTHDRLLAQAGSPGPDVIAHGRDLAERMGDVPGGNRRRPRANRHDAAPLARDEFDPLPPTGDDAAKAQAIADMGSSKDPGSPLHTIRKRKAAVKFYAQKRDGLSKEDAAKLAEEYELEAIDSARKGNGIPKASVMKGRTPKGVETPAPAPDAWQNASDVFTARQRRTLPSGHTLEVTDVIGGSNTEANPYGWAIYDADGEELDSGPAPTMKEGRRLADEAAKKLPASAPKPKIEYATVVEKSDDGFYPYKWSVRTPDGTTLLHGLSAYKHQAETDAAHVRQRFVDLPPGAEPVVGKRFVAWVEPDRYGDGFRVEYRYVDPDYPYHDNGSSQPFGTLDAAIAAKADVLARREADEERYEADRLKSRAVVKKMTAADVDAELASIDEQIRDMGEDEGIQLGYSAATLGGPMGLRDRVLAALDEARSAYSHGYGTVKIPSYSEISISEPTLRYMLTGKKPEGKKSVEELIDLDMWEAFKLGLGVEAKDVCLPAEETKARAPIRRVRTAEGARKYGVPIGTVITADMIERAKKPGAPRVNTGERDRAAASRAEGAASAAAERTRNQAARQARAAERDRTQGAAADAKIGDREKLAAVNKKRRAQGKPPLLKLPPERQRPSGGGYGVTKKAMNARGDGERPMKAGAYPKGDPRNDPEYAQYVQELQLKLDAAMEAGLDTETLHTVKLPGGGRVYSAERTAEHQRIIDQVMANAVNVPANRRAIMMGGLPGAGKSTFLRQHGAELGLEINDKGDPVNAIVINPDEMKSLLLNGVDAAGNPLVEPADGLKKGEMAELVHEESSHLANLLAERALAEGKDVVFDITLGNGEKARRKYLTNDRGTGARDLGYSVDAVFVDGDMPTSLHRAGLRHKQPNDKTGERGYSGRFVRYEHIASQGVRDPEARTSDGQKPKSQNRIEYDGLVADGVFDTALRYDNKTGEVVRDATPGTAGDPDNGDVEDQGDLALIDELETALQDGGLIDLGEGWQVAEDSGEFWIQRDSDANGGSTEVFDSFETVAELIEALRERGLDPNNYKVA